ncbi:MAG: ATP-binding cassette domain-containing protein [Calditrichia bacterium]
MSLLSLRDVSIAFGGPSILESITLQVAPGERVCIVGRNGEGKSTLLKLISGDLKPDNGEVWLRPHTRVARLTQEVPNDIRGSVHEVISEGIIRSSDEDWEGIHLVDKLIDQMDLDGEFQFELLSAGMKRRVLLARQLAGDPDLLLLDEPTNHLDIPSIQWLETFLQRYNKTLVFITHDRVFLQALTSRILEIDRGRISDWDCDYKTYLLRKEALLENEAKEHALFDKRLAQEEVWIRQGIKARRKRSQARIRQLKNMREERRNRRLQKGTANLQLQEAEKSGKLVCKANNISFSYGDETIIRDFSTTIIRGDRIGIIGPNGAGKSTLIQLLLGKLYPQSGDIHLGVRLQTAFFEQLRSELNDEESVQESIGEGKDMIEINGTKRHVISYLQDFLFSPEQACSPVATLSGGERNRLLLARLFTRPSNLLIMDEPTNDLDIETLELLEDKLLEYPGTLLLVSHDREFIDQVVTSTFAFEGDGVVKEYVGGYTDWLRQTKATKVEVVVEEKAAKKVEKPSAKSRKLSNKEREALEALPKLIESLETEQAKIFEQLGDPAFYQTRAAEAAELQARLEEIKQEMEKAFERWSELEEGK